MAKIRYTLTCLICSSEFDSATRKQRACSRRCGLALRSQKAQDPERVAARFWDKVDKNGPVIRPELGPCWVWLGTKWRFGYGRLSYLHPSGSHRYHAAHRFSWFLRHGSWPAECACHKCDNPECVNPDHLFDASLSANNADKFAKGRHRLDEPRVLGARAIRPATGRIPGPEVKNSFGQRMHHKVCTICSRPFTTIARRRETCSKRCGYARIKRRAMAPERIAVRFWPKVNKNGPSPAHVTVNGPCWEWTASVEHSGHGRIQIPNATNGRKGVVGAHRVSWFLHHGRWPDRCVLHRCDNPRCVNPDHLFEGTKADNVHDMHAKGRANPPRGEQCVRAKITESDVRKIREQAAAGKPQTQIAREMGITYYVVNSVKLRKSWRHVA